MKSILHFLQLTIILFSFFISTINLHAQLPDWRGEMPFSVFNLSDSAITDYQLLMTINTNYFINLGLMQINGNDIRFGSDCSGTILYNYWIEGVMNTDSTKIWVKIPLINVNDSIKLYMFFGNPSAPAVSTLSIFNGPWSSTDSVAVTNTNLVSNCQSGFRFTVNKPVLMTHFGKKTPNATSRYVTLFDYNTQSIVAQMHVSAGSSGTYNYNPISQPFWFNTGQQYVLTLYNGSGDWYYWGTSTQINPALTFGETRYCMYCTQNTFPTMVLPGYHYGLPDILFYMRKIVIPEPAITGYPPADTNTPSAPIGLSGIAGNQQVLLTWNKNPEFDIDRYLIFQNTINYPGTAVLIGSVYQPDTTFLVTGLTNGNTYYFWVKAQDRFCIPRISDFSNVVIVTPIAVRKISDAIPKEFALHQNYPNPFNPTTNIKYDLPKGSLVKIAVYDITGRLVAMIVNSYMMAGYHEATFNAVNLASGVYFYKIEAGTFTDEKKMVLVK